MHFRTLARCLLKAAAAIPEVQRVKTPYWGAKKRAQSTAIGLWSSSSAMSSLPASNQSSWTAWRNHGEEDEHEQLDAFAYAGKPVRRLPRAQPEAGESQKSLFQQSLCGEEETRAVAPTPPLWCLASYGLSTALGFWERWNGRAALRARMRVCPQHLIPPHAQSFPDQQCRSMYHASKDSSLASASRVLLCSRRQH